VRIEDALSEVESRQYIAARNYEKTEFEPHVDFTTASNFARYGSAKKYYEDAFTWIYTSYPYDGSALEKTEWYNSSSYIDRHIFEKEYPRTTGYVTLGSDYGSIIETIGGYKAPATASYEYIQVKGGPGVATDPEGLRMEAPGNVLKLSEGRGSNLNLDTLNSGSTVEFWMKKDSFD
jgi:hypothetical protein